MELSDQCKAIILGSLLGDGSLKIHKPYRNARFSFRHSVRQDEYFFWKVKALAEISSSHCYWRQAADGWSKNEKLRYQSLALVLLTDLYHLTHKNGVFSIQRRWLRMLTPLSLATWWLDDGSLIADSRQGVLCTDGFRPEELPTLKHYLDEVWGVKVGIGSGSEHRELKKRYLRLWLRSTESLERFLRIIIPHITVPSMLPKVLMLYKDTKLQQRWISEVCRLTNFSRDVVEHYVAEKRSKWAAFRE